MLADAPLSAACPGCKPPWRRELLRGTLRLAPAARGPLTARLRLPGQTLRSVSARLRKAPSLKRPLDQALEVPEAGALGNDSRPADGPASIGTLPTSPLMFRASRRRSAQSPVIDFPRIESTTQHPLAWDPGRPQWLKTSGAVQPACSRAAPRRGIESNSRSR